MHAERPDDLARRMVELYVEYSPVRALPDTHFLLLFHHLVNYSPGCYTYLWSLVIAKDMFSAFDPDDLLATDVARRYRDTAFTDWLDR